ncbi:restriction endonuclease subunit S [Bacillus cereus]|uniref:restriction endonuclease subunit S n=1 Tax=Bacillus cereus TaxID=1396 RepID=UPI000BF58C45|nr:restriction endonuclease subunit S [Bacillus cereus]PFQ31115.1 hypothetical protein COK16_01010 [Bacillus cereus]
MVSELKEKGFKNKEIEEIPDDWEVKKLGDLFSDMKTGSTPSRSVSQYYTGTIPWITSGELKYKVIYDTKEKITEQAVKDTNLRAYPKGTFFIAITGLEAEGTRGSCAITGVEATTNQSCLAFEPIEGFSNLYLYYWYRLHGDYIAKRYAQGTKQQSLNHKIVKEIEILVPPIEEQEKISAILSSVDEVIEKTEFIIEKTEKVKQGLMQQVFTKGIGHKEFKETEIGKIPCEWRLVRVSDLTLEHKQGYYTKDTYVEDGVYLIRITDLKNPKVDFSIMPKLDMDESIYEQFKVEKGDFLFARSGASIGRYGIVMEEDPKAVFASYLIRFKFNNEYVNNRYFGYFYESNACWKQIKSIIQGSSNPNINANNIKNLKIALPSLSEQKQIVDIICSVDEKIRINTLILQDLQTLKKGLMQSLLTGKVRVKVDEDEVTQV